MNGLSKLGIFFATSFGIFAGLVFVYTSRFGSISDTDALIEIYGLGQPTDILSKDGKFYYSLSKESFQIKAFIQRSGFFAATAIDGSSCATEYRGKEKWVRVPYKEDDPFQQIFDQTSVNASEHFDSKEILTEENDPEIENGNAGDDEDGEGAIPQTIPPQVDENTLTEEQQEN